MVAATTRSGLLTSPLRDRFGISFRLDYYTVDELFLVVKRSAKILGIEIADEGAMEIARRARGTPRIANRLLRRVRDYAQVKGDGIITREIAYESLAAMGIDPQGLDALDRMILSAIINNYDGGPVGLSTLAASISEDPGTIEDVYEPYLMQMGFLERTPRGRVATQKAFEYILGSAYRRKGLFDNP